MVSHHSSLELKVSDGEASAPEEVRRTRPAVTRTRLLPDPVLMWQVFRRNAWLFLLTVAVVGGAVAAWTLTRTPIYSTTATVLLRPDVKEVTGLKPVNADAPTDSDTVDTEVRLMESEALAARAARAYAADRPLPDVDDLGTDGGATGWTPAALDGLADRMQGMVAASRVGLTFLIDVTATGSDPELVAATANLFAENYVSSQRDAKLGESRSANTWLNERLKVLADNANSAQAALQSYRVRNGLMSAQGATMAEQEVSNLNTEITSAQAELAEKRGRLGAARAQLSRGGGGADVGAALGSNTIGSLRSQEAQVSARVAQLDARYGPKHPDLVQARSELRDVRRQLQGEINRILSSLQAEVRVAESRLSSLSGSRNGATDTLASNNRAQVGLAALEQRALAAQTIYEAFLNRSRETSAEQGLAEPDSRVAARADVPETPDFPNLRLMTLAGVAAALAAGLLAIGAAEYLRRGLQTKRDVEKRLRVRYAGAVPTLKSTLRGTRTRLAPHDYIVDHPHSLFAESFRSLRAFLTLGDGSAPRALAIASALPQEGKTTTSLCLARATALEGPRTVLVDCDLRRRQSSALLQLAGEHDLYDYLNGRATLDQAVAVDADTGLHLLATREAQPTAASPLSAEAVGAMLTELKARYDVIILDSAPVLGVADARLVASMADRTLLLTQWKRTSASAADAALTMLIEAGAKVAGVALTQVNIRKAGSTGDGDIYAYQKKFRGYYDG